MAVLAIAAFALVEKTVKEFALPRSGVAVALLFLVGVFVVYRGFGLYWRALFPFMRPPVSYDLSLLLSP